MTAVRAVLRSFTANPYSVPAVIFLAGLFWAAFVLPADGWTFPAQVFTLAGCITLNRLSWRHGGPR